MPDLKRPPYIFDPRLRNGRGAYRSTVTGRIVSDDAVRGTLFQYIDSKTTDDLARELISRRITLTQWQLEMRNLISDGHLTAYALAKGGWSQINPADRELLSRILLREYQYLDDFAAEIVSGEYRLDGRFRYRSTLYEESFYTTFAFVDQREAELNGAKEERSILDPGAEHCGTCVAEAAKGWIPIGSGIPIGGRECQTKCRCHKIFR